MKYIKLFEGYWNLETVIGKIASDVMNSKNTEEGSDVIETMLEDLGKNISNGSSDLIYNTVEVIRNTENEELAVMILRDLIEKYK
jgi:hypothetical protein